MNRKKFLRLVLSGTLGFAILPLLNACENEQREPIIKNTPIVDDTSKTSKKVTIGICTDVHQEYFVDMNHRLNEFITDASERNVDFIIQLGDFCDAKPKNDPFMAVWNKYTGPKYHVIGNHDVFANTKQEFLNYVGGKERYYSFDKEGYHFVVLDPNFGSINGNVVEASNGNVFKMTNYGYLDDEQLDWLEADLKNTNKRTILFSHIRLHIDLQERTRFDNIIKRTNSKYKKVIAAFAGHDHLDWVTEKNGVHHIQVNSMCYNWPNSKKYPCRTRFSAEVYKAYPIMEYMFPYANALYTFIELDPIKQTISMTGKKGKWISPSPEDMKAHTDSRRSPSISTKQIIYI